MDLQFRIAVLDPPRDVVFRLQRGRPAPVQGAIFRREWWGRYSAPPPGSEVIRTVLSVDTAFSRVRRTHYSAVTVWAETETAFYLLHA